MLEHVYMPDAHLLVAEDGYHMRLNGYRVNRKTRLSCEPKAIMNRFGLVEPSVADEQEWDKFQHAMRKGERILVQEWLHEAGMDDVKIHFSRTAGCSCGCSPAWIADRQIILDGKIVTDVYIR